MYPVSFYILAGGKNSRMGKDKGLLPFSENQTFVEKIISELSPLKLPVTIISENPAYQPYAHTIPDLTPKIGPLGGIYTALAHASTDYVFILTCDSPFITTGMIKEFLQNCRFDSGIQACVTKSNGRIYPLTAVYRKTARSAIETMITEKNYRVKDLLPKIKYQEILLPEQFVRNINRPEEYKQYILTYENH